MVNRRRKKIERCKVESKKIPICHGLRKKKIQRCELRKKKIRRFEFDLPKEIIQHIQSFLDGNEAAKTGLLSKSWYNAWSTRPILDLNKLGDLNDKEKDNEIDILMSVRRTMCRYKELNLKVEKLVIRLPRSQKYYGVYDHDNNVLTDILIEDASALGIKELALSCESHYCFPARVFKISSLTKLSVCGDFEMDQHCRVLCSRLVSLHLHQVEVHDALINILLACPLIENLYLSDLRVPLSGKNVHKLTTDRVLCPHLASLRLDDVCISEFDFIIIDILSGSPLIENLEMHQCYGMSNINLSNLHNLVSLCVRNRAARAIDGWAKVSFESISVPEFHKLCYVSLEYVTVDDDFFTKFSSRFPCIEDLKLDHCNGYESIQISSQSLKYFKLHQENKLLKAEFDVPSIRKFVFNATHGDYIPCLFVLHRGNGIQK